MPRLDEDAGKGTEEDLVVREPEAVDIRALAELLLFDQGSADVVQLSLDLGVVSRERRKTRESTSGSLVLALLDEPTGRLREIEHAGREDERPDELDGDRDLPRGVVRAVLGCVVHDGGEQETDSDRPLVAGNDGTTDPLGRTLGLVHGDEGGDETDTGTGKDTADNEGGEVGSTRLESDTEGENQAGEDDAKATTKDISHGSTEKGTCAQRGLTISKELGVEKMTYRRRYQRRGWRLRATLGTRAGSNR